MTISGTDFWWNTVRPRATNTCEVYPNGSVTCAARPYAISPIQVTIFSLLGTNYFGGLSGGTHAKWHRKYAIKAAVIPGATVSREPVHLGLRDGPGRPRPPVRLEAGRRADHRHDTQEDGHSTPPR